VIHESFDKTDLRYNVALLFLKNDIQLSDKINTICLSPQNQSFEGKRCLVSGWGKDKFGKEGRYSPVLKKIEVPTVPNDICRENLKKAFPKADISLHESLMCAGGEEGKNACKGDGGSPLVCPVEGVPDQYYQAGIVAWGKHSYMNKINFY